MKLHGYFRSSASYRVRIALNLKGLSADHLPHHLRKGEQRDPVYLAINPQGLVPTLQDGGSVITQSLAIIEWLDETHPTPPLLPKDPLRRALVRAFAQVLACDRTLNMNRDRLNVNGGAIAIGHPIGCTGTRITVTLLHEMLKRNTKRGVATLCVSGGMGMALALENVV